MKIYSEIDLKDFEFWAGAIENAKFFTIEDLELIQNIFEEDEESGHIYSETDINDIFWFEFETLAEWCGYEYDEENDIYVKPEN